MHPLQRAACVILVAVVFTSAPGFAHEATNVDGQPLGWNYDSSCCGGKDCRPLKTRVIAGPNGWEVQETGEVIGYDSDRIRDSRDGLFHRCHYNNGYTRCLYVPPRGF